jgi:glutathione S-transferase
LKLNPRGLVPTLRYDNKPLYESTVLCEFLEDAYPSYTPSLIPTDPYTKAYSKIWIDFITSRIIPSFHRYLQYQPSFSSSSPSPLAGLAQVRKDFLSQLEQFTNAMDSTGPYFLGKELSLVDLILAPWALRLWVFDHFKGGLRIPEGEKVWERWVKWLGALEKRESVVQSTSEKEYYLPIYQRYADNVAQSELAKATREGRGVP